MFAGIRLQDLGYWTGVAHIRRPLEIMGFEQAAFFNMPAAKVIPVKVVAFLAGWSDHRKDYS